MSIQSRSQERFSAQQCLNVSISLYHQARTTLDSPGKDARVAILNTSSACPQPISEKLSGSVCRLKWVTSSQGQEMVVAYAGRAIKKKQFCFLRLAFFCSLPFFWHKHCSGHAINLENRSGSKPTISAGLIFDPDHFPILIHYKTS